MVMNIFHYTIRNYMQKAKQYRRNQKKQLDKNQKNKQKLLQVIQYLFLSGLPGTGKTTALNYLIHKLKNQGVILYYINMRQDTNDQKIQQQKREDLLKLLEAVSKEWKNKQVKEYKIVKIIIDDINRLERFSPSTYQSDLDFITRFGKNKKIDVICVSSSSAFIQKINNFSFIEKQSKIYILKKLFFNEYQFFSKKVIEKLDKQNKIFESVRNHMIQKQYSLRKISLTIRQLLRISQLTQEKQLDFLLAQDAFQQQRLFDVAQQVLQKINNNKMAFYLVDQILENKDQYQMINCINVRISVRNKMGDNPTTNMSEALQKLDIQNLIIFCRPKSKIHRTALQNYRKDIKIKMSLLYKIKNILKRNENNKKNKEQKQFNKFFDAEKQKLYLKTI